MDRGETLRPPRHPPPPHRSLRQPQTGPAPPPPILIGGRSAATLRIAAEHADLWNIPGGDIEDVVRRSALLDRYCREIGRDPARITRSIHLPVSYDRPGSTRDAITEAIDAGFTHLVLGLPSPYPAHVARWVTEELVNPSVRPVTSSRTHTPRPT